MTPHHYVLDEKGIPVIEPDLMKWAMWFEHARESRIVARTKMGDAEVSTVFLGLDHNWSHVGPPVLWETMIFGGEHDQEQLRCTGSREQAEALHASMVKRLKPPKLKVKR